EEGGGGPTGPIVMPGSYTVALSKRVDGKESAIAPPQTFVVESASMASVPAADRPALLAFQQKAARLQRAVAGASELLGEAKTEVAAIKKALLETPKATGELTAQAT